MKHMWSEEEIQSFKKDISNLVDSKGNPRFVEGEGTYTNKTGVTISYCKWSLSGTHLMCVLAGSIASGTTFQANEWACTFDVPQFIYDKVVVTFGSNLIEIKNTPLYASNWATQIMAFQLRKDTANVNLNIRFGELTLTEDRTFRLQCDLLIDSE